MEALPLDQLAAVVGGSLVGSPGPAAEAVTIHSERIRRGSVFFALPGRRTDGHAHVADALANGAVAAVVSRPTAGAGPQVVVDDPMTALHRLAAWWRDRIAGEVIAVVGSNGKTVTKDALVRLAGDDRRVHGSPGSYNSQVGVPLAVLDCPAAVDLAVFEAAFSRPGELGRLASVLRPDRVVVTNLGTRWLANFDGRPGQAAELATMAAGLPAERVLVGEDAGELREALGPYLVVGTGDLPRFGPPGRSPEGLSTLVRLPDGRGGELLARTPSAEILRDVETAFTAAWLAGVDPGALLSAARDVRPTSTRVEIWKAPTGVTVVRDLATPDPIAVRSAVRAAAGLRRPGGRLVVVLGEDLPAGELDAPAVAAALAEEGAGAVHALDVPAHRGIAAGLPARVPVALAPGVPALRDELLADLRPDDVVLVQTAPEAAIGDLAVALMESMAPNRLYLDLGAIEDNVAALRRLVGPRVRIMGMVKALAYGTDAPGISLALQAAGIDALGVSSADEGIALRRAGVSVPVLVLLGTAAELDKMLRHRLTPLVYAPDVLDAVLARAGGEPVEVHLEVDSGMHRTGFAPGAALDALARLAAAPGVTVTGVMTHLASADDPDEDPATAEQLRRFRAVWEGAGALGLHDLVRHAAATAATLRVPDARLDQVRVGLGLYGVHPSPASEDEAKLTPAVGFVSRVVEVVEVPAGERVGYGGTFTAPDGGARVAVVPAGYHDGVPRSASNAGVVVVGGVRCPIVGRVSMDSMAVDVTAVPDAGSGSDVLVYGRYHDWSLPVEELAASSGTIAHEVLARIGPRVQRILTRH